MLVLLMGVGGTVIGATEMVLLVVITPGVNMYVVLPLPLVPLPVVLTTVVWMVTVLFGYVPLAITFVPPPPVVTFPKPFNPPPMIPNPNSIPRTRAAKPRRPRSAQHSGPQQQVYFAGYSTKEASCLPSSLSTGIF
jgi:hypothetical protein